MAKVESAGGTAPVKWVISPALPAGLTFDGALGTIGGTATGPAGNTEHTFTGTDSTGAIATAKLTLDVVTALAATV